jgi:hypothetical protein
LIAGIADGRLPIADLFALTGLLDLTNLANRKSAIRNRQCLQLAIGNGTVL